MRKLLELIFSPTQKKLENARKCQKMLEFLTPSNNLKQPPALPNTPKRFKKKSVSPVLKICLKLNEFVKMQDRKKSPIYRKFQKEKKKNLNVVRKKKFRKCQIRKFIKNPLNFGFCQPPTSASSSSGPCASFPPLSFHFTVLFAILF